MIESTPWCSEQRQAWLDNAAFRSPFRPKPPRRQCARFTRAHQEADLLVLGAVGILWLELRLLERFLRRAPISDYGTANSSILSPKGPMHRSAQLRLGRPVNHHSCSLLNAYD